MSIFKRSRSTITKSIEKRSGLSGEFTIIEDATEPSFNTEGTVEILRPYDKVQIIIFAVVNVTFAANILIVRDSRTRPS